MKMMKSKTKAFIAFVMVLLRMMSMALLAFVGMAPVPSSLPLSLSSSSHMTFVVAAEDSTTAATTAPPSMSMLTNAILQSFLDDFIAMINGEIPIYEQTGYEQTFDDFFLNQIPLSSYEEIILDLQMVTSPSATWDVIDVVSDQGSVAVVLIAPTAIEIDIDADQQEAEQEVEPQFYITLALNPQSQRLNGLLIQPSEEPTLDNAPTSVQDAADRLNQLAQNFQYVIADPDDGCSVRKGQRETELAPIGSMFKLWVLGSVVDAINFNITNSQQPITWDTEMVVTDTDRSLPSGIVQADDIDNPPNRTVRQLAELMISISDNTATDMLIRLVGGRPTIEQTLYDYGHSDPTRNIPFLKTKDLFVLKLDGAQGDGKPGQLGQVYINDTTTADERREILQMIDNHTLSSDYNLDILTAWSGGPIAIEDIEWFASPVDVCRVMAKLVEDDEASRILAINPGIRDSGGIWSYVGFKGGSEPGVLGLSWYVVPNTTADGNGINALPGPLVVSGMLWDPDNIIVDETQATLLMGALRDLVSTSEIVGSDEDAPTGLSSMDPTTSDDSEPSSTPQDTLPSSPPSSMTSASTSASSYQSQSNISWASTGILYFFSLMAMN
jgi:beta-lactamase class A